MSDLSEHIKEIDEFTSRLGVMSEEGHLDEFNANTYAGAAREELSMLRGVLAENPQD
jgi:hypothetical protein